MGRPRSVGEGLSLRAPKVLEKDNYYFLGIDLFMSCDRVYDPFTLEQ